MAWIRNPLDWRRIADRIARITGHPDRAEDLLHSAFLRMEEYRVHTQVAQPEAFLVKVAVNLARDEGRHTRIRSELPCSVYDLIDLPDWGRIYGAAELTITRTLKGAEIVYGTESLTITKISNGALDLTDADFLF